jgi:uncharacterized protein YhfF
MKRPEQPDRAIDAVGVHGAALRRVDAWKKLHRQYWKARLASHGLAPDGDLPVLCQRFELCGSAAKTGESS